MALLRRNKRKTSDVTELGEEIKNVQNNQPDNNEQPKEPENKSQQNENQVENIETEHKVSRRTQSLQDFLF